MINERENIEIKSEEIAYSINEADLNKQKQRMTSILVILCFLLSFIILYYSPACSLSALSNA
jgi:hypothetical protein